MAKRNKRGNDVDFAIGVQGSSDTVTARQAGGLIDLELCISPLKKKPAIALRHLAKAMNLALKSDFVETPLDDVYQAARVRKGSVQILHRDYIGLGDGIFASLGKSAKSFQLTLKGPDAASPTGRAWIEEHGGGALTGVLNLLGRKLNLLQEFENKVPIYVEQALDRLEAQRMITDWHRNEWEISTTVIGLDVIMRPAQKEDG